MNTFSGFRSRYTAIQRQGRARACVQWQWGLRWQAGMQPPQGALNPNQLSQRDKANAVEEIPSISLQPTAQLVHAPMLCACRYSSASTMEPT